MRREVKTIEQYAYDIIVSMFGEESEGDKIIKFADIPRLVPTAIRIAEAINIVGSGKRISVIAAFNEIKTRFIVEGEQDLMVYFVEHQLPFLIDEIVLIAKSKALIRKSFRCCK